MVASDETKMVLIHHNSVIVYETASSHPGPDYSFAGPRPKYFVGPHYTYSTKPRDSGADPG